METSSYQEIGSTLLDHDLVDPDLLKKAIAKHRKMVENGAEIPFLDFLVDKDLISQRDAELYFHQSEQDTPTLDPPPERTDYPEEKLKEENEEQNFYEQYKQRRSRSRRTTYIIIGSVLALLGLGIVYAYNQYSQSRSAQEALKKAQQLEEQHQYQKALTVISDDLLEPYPSSAAASKGKTLQENIQKILKRKQTVINELNDLQSSADPPETSDAVSKFTHVKELRDQVNGLNDRYEGFLKEHFGAPSDSEEEPDLLADMKEFRASLSNRMDSLIKEAVQQNREKVRGLIQSRSFAKALEVAKTFDRKFDSSRAETVESLTDLARSRIRKAYENTKKRIQQTIRNGESDKGLPEFRKAMDKFGDHIPQKRLTEDLEELKDLRVAVRRRARKKDESASKKRKDPDQSKKKEEPSIPFNKRTLVTRDGTVIQGRIVDLEEERVVLATQEGKQTMGLRKLRPFSAADVLHTVGKEQQAITYAMEHEAYEMARVFLSGKTKGGPWQQASVQAANQFLDGAVRMSPQTLQNRVDRKEKALQQKTKKKLLDKDKYADSPVQSVERIVYNGDVSRRLDIVFVNDGWTKEKQDEYNKLCEQLADRLLQVKPFLNYKRYINFHRVNLISDQTEIDGSTVLGTKLEDDDNKMIPEWGDVQNYGKYATDADLVVNVVNVEDARANAGVGLTPGVINLNRSEQIGGTAVHELGHAFGDLDDEYSEKAIDRSFSRDEEDEHINTTRVSDSQKVKWHYWRFPEPPPGRQVGTYEGAYYNAEGYYRPSPRCRMRNSSMNYFCVVCREQMELSFYRRVSPLDRVNPFQQTIDQFKNEDRRLLANTITTKTRGDPFGVLKANWYLNGRSIDRTHSTTLKTWVNTGELSLPPGTHQLAVHIAFQNDRVRRDYGYLSDAHVWTVNVRRYEKPELRIAGDREAEAGSSFELSLQIDAASRKNGLQVKPLDLPPGASFDGEKARITWTPTSRQTGSHALKVGVVDTKQDNEVVLERTVRVTVNQPGRQNQSPLMYAPPVLAVDEGEPLNYRIKAWDPDNDFLTYRIPNRPDGLILDPKTGRIHWKLGYRHGFEKGKIKLIATDGHQQVSKEVTLVVMDKPLPDHQTLTGYNAMHALRSRNVQNVKYAFRNQLRNLPRMYQYLESIRLLRHREPSVRSLAIDRIRTIFEQREITMKKRYVYILFSRLIPHMFHFTDSPDVLNFLQSLVKRTKDVEGLASGAETIRSKLKAIRTYNRKRGVTATTDSTK